MSEIKSFIELLLGRRAVQAVAELLRNCATGAVRRVRVNGDDTPGHATECETQSGSHALAIALPLTHHWRCVFDCKFVSGFLPTRVIDSVTRVLQIERRRELLRKRNQRLKIGLEEEDLPREQQLEYIRCPIWFSPCAACCRAGTCTPCLRYSALVQSISRALYLGL